MNRQEKLNIIINSTLHFLASYLFVYVFFTLITYTAALAMGIDSGITGNKLTFRIPDHSPLWTNISIIAVIGMPSILSLGMSYISRYFYNTARKRRSNLKLFWVWTSLHFNVLFWANWVSGLATSSDFGAFLNWVYMPFWLQIVLGVGGLVLLYLQNGFTLYGIVQTAPSRAYVAKSKQKEYKKFAAIYPYIAGSLVLFLLGIPSYAIADRIFTLIYLFNLIPILQYIDEEEVKLVKNSDIFKPDYLLIIPFLLIVIILLIL